MMQKSRKHLPGSRRFALLLLCPLMLIMLPACYSGGLPPCEASSPPSKYPDFQVVNGMAYLYSDGSSSFYALHASDGTMQWKYHASGLLPFEKVIDGIVFTESDGPGNRLVIYALRATDGKILWQKDGANLQLMEVADGIAYVSSDDQLLALQEDSGDLLWQRYVIDLPTQTGKNATPSADSDSMGLFSVTESNDIVYSLSFAGYLTAFRSTDGTFIWQDHIDAPHGFPYQYNHFPIENNMLYIQTDRIYAIQANNGKLLWQFYNALPPPQATILSMIVTPAAVYVLHRHLYALQPQSGKLLWQFPTATVRPYFFNDLSFPQFMLLNGVIYIGALGNYSTTFTVNSSGSNYIPAIRARDGKLLWYYTNPINQPYNAQISPAASGTEVYFLRYSQARQSSLNTLEAHSVSDGKVLWQRSLHDDVLLLADNGSLYASAAGATGTGCYPSAKSYMDKLNPSDGMPIWHFEAGDVTQPSL